MDRILLETDLVQASKDWAALDKKIMEKVPFIPRLYDRAYQVYGPKVGGVFISQGAG